MMDKIRYKKSKKRPVPSIQITLTTFSEDENGELSCISNGIVKIDGEDNNPKQPVLDWSLIFKSAIVRNLLILSFGQFLLFMSFNSLFNLQRTMNTEGSIGTISLVVVYAAMTVSSFFLPTVIIRTLKCKKTLVFATVSFCPYILGNFYPHWYTLIPTAIVCGMVSGPLWCARCTYLNQISHSYAKLQNISVEIMNAWFFSVCTTFYQNTEIWGNILSFYILRMAQDGDIRPSESVLINCGPDFCDDGNLSTTSNLQVPSADRRYILITILTALVLIAAFFTVFFLDAPEYERTEETGERTFSFSELLAAFYQFSKIDQLLLLPLSLYTGLVDGFYNGDFPKAYVECAWGVPHMGAVSICYGVVSALVDSACGPCIQILGRAGLFFLASVAHFTMFLALSMWKPDHDNTSGFFLIAGAHGIGNGVWMSQIVALYGVLFKENEESAFSCFYFLNSLGFLLAYSYNTYLCTKIKLFIPLVVLVIGLVCYLAVEVRMVKRSLLEYRGRVQESTVETEQLNLTSITSKDLVEKQTETF